MIKTWSDLTILVDVLIKLLLKVDSQLTLNNLFYSKFYVKDLFTVVKENRELIQQHFLFIVKAIFSLELRWHKI